jgi:hypothetical protein
MNTNLKSQKREKNENLGRATIRPNRGRDLRTLLWRLLSAYHRVWVQAVKLQAKTQKDNMKLCLHCERYFIGAYAHHQRIHKREETEQESY